VTTTTRTAPTLIADPRRRGTRGFAAFTTFLAGAAVLGLGLVYVWVKGDFEWVKSFQQKRRVQG